MKCPKCGFENPDESNACLKCGIIFKKIKAAPPLDKKKSPQRENAFSSPIVIIGGLIILACLLLPFIADSGSTQHKSAPAYETHWHQDANNTAITIVLGRHNVSGCGCLRYKMALGVPAGEKYKVQCSTDCEHWKYQYIVNTKYGLLDGPYVIHQK